MSSENAIASLSAEQLVERRLDDLDRALLSLLPRGERLAIVQQVEAKVRSAGHASLTAIPAAGEATIPATVERRRALKPRSRMALTAGILGIIALVLLFVSPFIYGLVVVLDSALDETLQIGVLGTQVGLMTFAGLLAVVLGLIALIQLSRSQELRRGHAWAITGLCTGPLPLLIGGLLSAVVGAELFASSATVVCVPETSFTPAGSVPPYAANSYAISPSAAPAGAPEASYSQPLSPSAAAPALPVALPAAVETSSGASFLPPAPAETKPAASLEATTETASKPDTKEEPKADPTVSR
jgi:hypothetical protein